MVDMLDDVLGGKKSFYGNHFRIPTIEEMKEYLRKKSE